MSTNILFIFEGDRPEESITDSLTKFYVNENTLVTSTYGNNIYKLYKEIIKDEDLDSFTLIKDIAANREPLKGYRRSDFAQIFLFFDYDGHDSSACDATLNEMIRLFNDETDKGKLYISYPMAEALKHIEDFGSFKDLKVAFSDFSRYKQIVNDRSIKSLHHMKKYDKVVWKDIILAHLMKMNTIVNGSYDLPNAIVDQGTILGRQKAQHIDPHKCVAVLSAFPVFVHDYYGNEGTRLLLR